ncbi:hypothetical protein [Cupriavidus taiwanensis]|uniref:hypothetical protein n=1 Tax=Cupriavidus taiwanensis TaxID=164546 RepID=UPI000E1235CE|nr:hypothetical protein [Cupriavidus taiwanensis]SPA17218.1 conserved hypothetical protein [Cupriavidus taiwanensis]
MGRIRTIRPEFCESESLGRCTRDARLLFLSMLTRADDEGRLRGRPELLATLFPYDKDAASLIVRWLDELEQQGCIQRYEVEHRAYIAFTNWATHQLINRPTPSRLPPPPARASCGTPNVEQANGTAHEASESDPGMQIHGGLTEDSLSPHGAITEDSLAEVSVFGSGDVSGKGKGKGKGKGVQREGNPSSEQAPTCLPVSDEKVECQKDDTDAVFEHWRQAMHSPRSRLDDRRRKVIRNALTLGYSVRQLCDAIDGCASSAWHMGRNDRGVAFNGIDLILRDAEHVDRFVAMRTAPPMNDLERIIGRPQRNDDGRDVFDVEATVVGNHGLVH